jgi:hypothetical protein
MTTRVGREEDWASTEDRRLLTDIVKTRFKEAQITKK